MFNWFKKLFGKSEERSFPASVAKVQQLVSLEKYHQFRRWLATEVDQQRMKSYKCVNKFLENGGDKFEAWNGEFPLDVDFDLPNNAMTEFLDTFGFLNCKTTNEKFAAYVKKYSKYAK